MMSGTRILVTISLVIALSANDHVEMTFTPVIWFAVRRKLSPLLPSVHSSDLLSEPASDPASQHMLTLAFQFKRTNKLYYTGSSMRCSPNSCLVQFAATKQRRRNRTL